MGPRIYTDTSVIGGCLDPEYREPSLALIKTFAAGKAIIVLSDLTLLELSQAPRAVRKILERIPDHNREHVELREEATVLAGRYIEAAVVTKAQLVDAQHIAIATLSRVDVLVSWNFKHIVNLRRIQGYNSVNLRFGRQLLEIRTPLEVIEHGNG